METVTVSESILISGGYKQLGGYALKATTDAVINLRNGDDASAPIVIPILLGANQSIRDDFVRPITFGSGMYFEVASGDIEGSVWLAA